MDIDDMDRYRRQVRRIMLFSRAVDAKPPRRWTFWGYGVLREHEHFFNTRRR